ncbi:2-hydroxyglutaryl-CoA dehydratase activator [Chitinivibrio alkaliphilus]|uniref:Putative activator of 2-hydroxyglutaryl-CoA dehydratase n=1 Tax=Chitinivibrio alkaliphilus ACht1 TaxID=1313304 RepID=U7D768_9BACT|nr:2-hydroxyglutaryl-CoA dehydratase activator [Chitinivibrio alkaliphilus]ERP30932.1 Putative activator of 2-hydroxyglutaryl-CoA dehydratase [Chitinivibrio alkaliphilus ACht1]
MKITEPKIRMPHQWDGLKNPLWHKKDRKKVTILYNMIERRKSYFLRAYFEREGYAYRDMGDHVFRDLQLGRKWGTRMQCNPMYFTSGAIVRSLLQIEKETGLSKKEIVEQYVFLCGGGQCGPCRYGMYPKEYLKAVNAAGFHGFRLLIFNSDIIQDPPVPKEAAFPFDVNFKINFAMSFVLADMMHIAECALRPYVDDKDALMKILGECEEIILRAFTKKAWLLTLPGALRRVSKKLAAVPRKDLALPKIFITGEVFANMAHNDGNYNLRRFIMDEGAEVLPAIFSQRGLYESWRRIQEAKQKIRYATSKKERRYWKIYAFRQGLSYRLVYLFFKYAEFFFSPSRFGGSADLHHIDYIARLGHDYYHTLIFGGEGNLEIGEAVHYHDSVDGFISVKPFACMPSSGVSDGVQAKIISLYPHLNFLSIETSGDNQINILNRVSMLIHKAREKMKERQNGQK